MFEKNSQCIQECVFFMSESGVTQEMLFSEFEAILDGVVGLIAYANTAVPCVFAVIEPGLKCQALVFFIVDFDHNGEPVSDWNVPFHSLIQKSSVECLGSFKTKIVRRSVCPIELYQKSLWDPTTDHLEFFASALELNKLCLATTDVLSEQQTTALLPSNQSQSALLASQSSLPGLMEEVAKKLKGADHQLSQSVKTLSTDLHAMSIRANQFEQQYHAAREQLLQQQVEFTNKTTHLEHNVDQKIQAAVVASKKQLKKKFENKLKSYEQEYQSRFSTRLGEIQTSSSVVSQQLQAQKELLREKDDLLAEKMATLDQQQAQIATLEITLKEKSRTIETIEVTGQQLLAELTSLRKEKLRLLADGADKFFQRLEDSGLSFIAFHPGAGHVSVSVSRVADYLANPVAFAAEKINMDEQAYVYWLNHYEKPCCQAPIMGGTTCAEKIKRHENPRDFTPGTSDRCERHRTGVSAIGRIFSS